MLDRRRPRPPVPFVVLTEGWAGERVLVRLLAAGGTVRCSGSVLARPRRHPGAHLRRALRRAGTQDLAHGAVLQADHLWLRNDLEPTEFVEGLRADGIRLLTLRRRRHVDRGISRILCGSDVEVLPVQAAMVDAGQVAVFAHDGEQAAAWFDALDALGDAIVHLVFEDDLVATEARAATAARLATWLGLEPWTPVPDPELPTNDALWRLVANPESLAAGLADLAPDYELPTRA